MAILIFLVILALLILVHEFGHFIVAKKSGIKVTEFGLGFPPRVWSKQKGETVYSLNAIPFGGFVKIFGENPDLESIEGPEKERSIIHKPRLVQVAVLAAGVTFNIIFAWLLISLGYMIGLPTSADYQGAGKVENAHVIVTAVEPNSPALNAGLKPGDAIVNVESESRINVVKTITPENISNFVEAYGKGGVIFEISRGKELKMFDMKASEGVVPGQIAVGVALDTVGTLKLPVYLALWRGALVTASQLKSITVGIFSFFKEVFTGHGDISQVTGPVGIVGLVGDVTTLGFVYLLSFTALISLNLAVINLLPFPALDGGRIVVVAIEGLIRRRLSPKVLNTVNGIGFALLIILMVVVTIHDVIKLF
jgi:regulator of sigma E protease